MFVLKCRDDRLKDDRKRIRGFKDNKKLFDQQTVVRMGDEA
jgi:hypothetical protein